MSSLDRIADLDVRALPTEMGDYDNADFAGIVRPLGAQGVTVNGGADLDQLGEWLVAQSRPAVVDCKIDPTIVHPGLMEVVRRQVTYSDASRRKPGG